MSGETDLQALLKTMRPVLMDGVFVFHSSDITLVEAAALDPILTFQEREGMALILRKEIADDAGLRYTYPSRVSWRMRESA